MTMRCAAFFFTNCGAVNTHAARSLALAAASTLTYGLPLLNMLVLSDYVDLLLAPIWHSAGSRVSRIVRSAGTAEMLYEAGLPTLAMLVTKQAIRSNHRRCSSPITRADVYRHLSSDDDGNTLLATLSVERALHSRGEG